MKTENKAEEILAEEKKEYDRIEHFREKYGYDFSDKRKKTLYELFIMEFAAVSGNDTDPTQAFWKFKVPNIVKILVDNYECKLF